jgi:tRNA C32,U32 (ribose-2'-O)-methylase TrmJ
MSEYHYPDITDHAQWAFKTVVTLAREDSNYLKSPDCPYDDQLKKLIQDSIWMRLDTSENKQENTESSPISEDEIDNTLAEDLYGVFQELKDYGKTIGKSDQTERMAYFRTATSLLERLVTARERALGVKQIKGFQDTVLAIMEDSMTPDQRTEVMDRLRSALARQDMSDDGATATTTDENA